MATPKMLCIGTATQDVFLVGGEVFKPVCEHGVCFEHLPMGAKLDIEKVVFSTGGNAGNAATTFARQGLDVEFMGIVGTEPAGESVIRDLDKEGVGTRHVDQDKRHVTGYSTILLAPTGERTVLVSHGSQLRADGSELDLSAIAKADWLYLSSVGSLSLLEKIVSLAAKNGVKVALNPSSREITEAAKLRPILDDVEALITNKEEMAKIVEGNTAESLLRHAAQLVKIIIISDGPKGALATDGKQLVQAGMYEDVKVVDRLGAGDAFGSGFVAMLAGGKDLAEAVTFASANATAVVTKIGAKTGILHRHNKLHDMPLKISDL